MLPRNQGGVVDANLRVYGLSNVRVADASVPPIALSTHLMASTYGIAEQAANIIRGFWNAQAQPQQPAYSSSGPSSAGDFNATKGSGSSTAPQSNTSPSGTVNGASPLRRVWASLFLVGVHVVLVLGLAL